MDTNALVSGLLRDLSAVQSERQSSLGYERAANTVFNLERPLETYVEADGTLRKIPSVGPKSERVALEALRTGGSPFVEKAIRASAQGADVEKGRALRTNFMSRARVLETLESPRPGRSPRPTIAVTSRCTRRGATEGRPSRTSSRRR